MRMATIIETLTITELPIIRDYQKALDQRWVYVDLFEDGSYQIKAGNVSDEEKKHALKNFYFIEEKA